MDDKSGTQNKDSRRLDRQVVFTDDGSASISIPGMNEMYHSRKGAIKESVHVYIEHGLKMSNKNPIQILEIGMGTGLNVFLTYLEGIKNNRVVEFHSLEPYPLIKEEWSKLNYAELLDEKPEIMMGIHTSIWETPIELTETFSLTKFQIKLEDFSPKEQYDVIYFDAFAPNKQQDPWQIGNIQKCYDLLSKDGVLTTYCSQGQFKRNLVSVGFEVTNPVGPMGKREITVAYKR